MLGIKTLLILGTTGRKINSQFLKLKKWLSSHAPGMKLDILNVSYPKDASAALQDQIKEIKQAMQDEQYASLEYVTILMGADDACASSIGQETPLSTLKQNFNNAFSALAQLTTYEAESPAPPIRVLVVGIPRIPDLALFGDKTTLFGLSCNTVRNDILGYCSSLLRWKTPEEYQAALKTVQDVNQVIEESVFEADDAFPGKLDVVYTDRLAEYKIPFDQLAADCFHPSQGGQATLSEELWLEQPWFRLN